jgi:molecular chaperone GrpE
MDDQERDEGDVEQEQARTPVTERRVMVRIGDPAEPAPDIDVSDAPGAAGLGAELQAASRERDEYRDRLLRTAAEFENYRKRIERERRDQAELARVELVAELLPLLDDLERALEAEAPPGAEPYRRGVELIHRRLVELLRKRGVTPIEAIGTRFDPRVHEAVAYEESPGHGEGEVIGELRRGYKLGDRLLRAAMVRVARA